MKLDGEKLLEDLKTDLRFNKLIVKKIVNDEVYLSCLLGRISVIEQLIKSFKSGDYTIDKESEEWR